MGVIGNVVTKPDQQKDVCNQSNICLLCTHCKMLPQWLLQTVHAICVLGEACCLTNLYACYMRFICSITLTNMSEKSHVLLPQWPSPWAWTNQKFPNAAILCHLNYLHGTNFKLGSGHLPEHVISISILPTLNVVKSVPWVGCFIISTAKKWWLRKSNELTNPAL